MMTGPLVGLALGGGVMRGMAHIGVLKVFLKSGIPVHMVAGTSSGSIVAALYASGYSPERMEEIAAGLRPRDIFDYGSSLIGLIIKEIIAGMLPLPSVPRRRLGLMQGKKLEALLERLLGKDRLFSETKVPLGITAVDARDGTLVIFSGDAPTIRTVLPPEDNFVTNVPVAKAVRASIAVPGIFEPVRLDDRILVDGGVRDNVPSYVLRRMGADFVIAVDVGYDGVQQRRIDNIIDMLTQSFELVISEGINLKLERYADVVIRPVIKMSPWDFEKIEYCIRRGELAAAGAVEEIKQKLGIR
jgi:NTE family protein